MTDIAKTVVHSAAQLGIGIVVGGLCDASFPPAPKQKCCTTEELLWLSAETVLQVIANGLITAGVVKVLDRLDSSMADPTGALAYTMGMQESQPQLLAKIRLLGRHVTKQFSSYEKAMLGEDDFMIPGLSKSTMQRTKEKQGQ
jgi:hypothetical protein